MLLSLLALTVATIQTPTPQSPLMDASRAASAATSASVVYLDCQVSPPALTDCKVVNDDPVDAAAAATALKLAEGMSVPPALAGRGRIVVKLNVTP